MCRRLARPLGLALGLALGPVLPAGAAPTEGQGDPARARVAAQCAAFWEGAGAPRAAAAFRRLAEAEGEGAAARALVDRLRPAMARLAAERQTDPRAADLWARHAALCALPGVAGPR
jgi:hypothetical protein